MATPKFLVGQRVVRWFPMRYEMVEILSVLEEGNQSNAYSEPVYYVKYDKGLNPAFKYSGGSKEWVGEHVLQLYERQK